MKDTFGQALYGYWKGDHKTPHFVRREDGFLDETPNADYFRPELMSKEKALVKFARGKILDVGSGAGRALLYFGKKGFDICGIDFSPLAVRVCKERGLKAEMKDVFKMRKTSAYNTVLLFGNNIGIGGDLKGAENLLKKLNTLVDKKGRVLLTSMDVSKTDNPKHKAYHQMNLKRRKYVGEVKIRVEYKKAIGTYFKWIHLDSEKLKELAAKTGWKVIYLKVTKDGSYSAVLEK
ncbi:MAG: class I SAM-dependent methyltransferase [Candidatus Gracilibacteria bacterium]|jgi:SAM-dependent methyltransferase